MADGDDFDIKSNLRQVLADLKEFDPALARTFRRALRDAGQAGIDAMGKLLDEDGGGVVTGKTHRFGEDSATGGTRRYVESLVTEGAKRSRSSGAREEIKKGLKFRVTAGKSRTTVRLATTKGDLRKAMNARSWRHPVFGTDVYVEQPGSGYFSRGASEQFDPVKAALMDAYAEALKVLSTRTPRIE